MKILKLVFIFLIITISSKADDYKNTNLSSLLDDKFVISDKFMPDPFDGSLYFVLIKAKNESNQEISVEELYNIVANKKYNQLLSDDNGQNSSFNNTINISNNRRILINNKNLIVVICKVSIEKTNCRKP